jgi:ABC-type phosphate transport system permease subunit
MQSFGWGDRPQDAWRYSAAVASAILLALVLLLKGAAILIRNGFQRVAL